ncbi:MAG: NAD(P)/FAD-dependent oxidoreductase [Bryobacteraceae bacterium]
MTAGVAIVGGGQAGFQTAASLRAEGYEDPITLICQEPHLPYQRPPLSKGFLAGKQSIEKTELRPERFYADHRIDLILGDRAVSIDRDERRIALASGNRVAYEKLVLATGSRVRMLAAPDAIYLRDLGHAVELKQRIGEASGVAVIGGGFIGLEVAAVARALGKPVVVVEAQSRLMARVAAPEVSEFFRETHEVNGAQIALNATAEIANGSIRLNDGALHPADLVLAGIGVVPNVEFAREAGLAIGNGIVVDEYLRASGENIFAIGDCADHPNPFARGRARLESVQNAVDQAKCVAAQILGRGGAYCAVPWFWTDQFDIKLQMAGLSGGFDRAVVRGAPESRKFSVFYFRQGKLIAVDSINRPADHIAARKLLATGAPITPEQAADRSFDLKSAMPE